jgi:uncharacterized protein (TIGR02679 family)
MWVLVSKKYESYGRAAGTVRLDGLLQEEREALEGLFAVNMLGRSEFKFRLAELDRALQETKFKLSLSESLRLLNGDDWMTRQEQLAIERRSWERFCRWAVDHAENQVLRDWIEQLSSGLGGGYRVFLECYKGYRENGNSPEWAAALTALEQLPAHNERLPVFAARTTGDPHGLDRSSLAGRIFYWGMLALQGDIEEALSKTEPDMSSDVVVEGISQSETIREQYGRVGIVLDDISSIVWVAGWGDFAKDPVAMPLLTVERLDATGFSPVAEVFVVENPSIFGTILDRESHDGALPFPIVCTSGQPSLAALRLLDRMTNERSRIYYSGDFDVKGLTMAIGLSQRYGSRFVPWRLDRETYQAAVQRNFPDFSEAEIQALERLQISWDDRLVKAMRQSGKKVFQEQILDVLLKDWEAKKMG